MRVLIGGIWNGNLPESEDQFAATKTICRNMGTNFQRKCDFHQISERVEGANESASERVSEREGFQRFSEVAHAEGYSKSSTPQNREKLRISELPSGTLNISRVVTFFFPYNPPPPLPRQTPRPSHPEKLDFGPFRLCLAPFRLYVAPFRLRFGSVSGPFRGVGWGRGEGLL